MLGAVSSFIQGLQVNGTLTLKNGKLSSIVSCKYAHKIEINGTPTQSAISTPRYVDSSWRLKDRNVLAYD